MHPPPQKKTMANLEVTKTNIEADVEAISIEQPVVEEIPHYYCPSADFNQSIFREGTVSFKTFKTVTLQVSYRLTWTKCTLSFLFTESKDKTYLHDSICIPGGLPNTRTELFKLYDGVETFLMFIGYPRSSHSLVGALLDAHPQIIIANEYHIVNKWDIYRDDALRSSGMQKYLLFYNLHSISTWQATFGSRAKEPAFLDDGINSYNVPGAWQGSFDDKIKVNVCFHSSS